MKMLIAMDWGWSEMLWVALISICLVFVVLILLVFVMKGFGFAFGAKSEPVTVVVGQIHEEEVAAIMTALKIFGSAMHDRESEVLTILSIKRAYSPWNSKIHGLTQMPDRK